MITYRSKAAFLIGHRWTWIRWNHNHGNQHAAVVEKARELGAKGYDVGNSEHAELSRWNFGSQG